MGKRANGEGSITYHKKWELYMARYTMVTPTGPKRKTIYGKVREEVAAKLADALSDRNKGLGIDQKGAVQQTRRAYDKKVAGVISGAGEYKSAIIMDNQDDHTDRMPVALMGKVGCKVDATYSPIEVGDLLTTSPTPGHAMKVEDTLRASGAVIGKALRPLKGGQGIIPILVTLQ